MQWKVGDKVRLTGRLWGVTSPLPYKVGTEHEVTGVRADGWVQFEGFEHHWRIAAGWEIELVEQAEEKKMSVDISEVNVGDRVKLTRENGDEATFTVKRHAGDYLDTEHNSYPVNPEDTLEILEKKFELVPGLYSDGKFAVAVSVDGMTYFYAATWIVADPQDEGTKPYDAVRLRNGWRRLFEF